MGMRRWVLVVAIAAAARAGPARASIVDAYNSSVGPFFTSSANPANALDDGAFPAPPSGPITIAWLNLGYFVYGMGPASFDIRIDFYNTLNPTVGSGIPVNSDYLGGITIPQANINPGVRTTGLVDLRGLPDHGIVFPDQDWAVQVHFLAPGSTTINSDRATPLFAGGSLPLGANGDKYWRDINNDGLFTSNESRDFGGPPNRAQFFLQLKVEVVPEPASLALIGLTALFLARRRP